MGRVLDEGKTVAQVARDLDLTESALRTWGDRAPADSGKGRAGVLMGSRARIATYGPRRCVVHRTESACQADATPGSARRVYSPCNRAYASSGARFRGNASPGVGLDLRSDGLRATVELLPMTSEQATLIAGRWRIQRSVGTGGMGSVYLALDEGCGSRVALKLFHHGADLRRFEREAEILARLRHPRIVRYVDHGRSEAGQPFLVMEWLDGEDLAARLTCGALPIDETVAILHAVAEGLACAHAQGVIHRDLKPANVFLGRSVDEVKLLDFGVARLGPRSTVSATGLVVGSPAYMAPEQARGAREVDARVDLFALGAVVFECLTGRRAFTGQHAMAVLAKVLFENPPSVASLRPELPAALDRLVAALLAKDPSQRPRDVAAVLAVLGGEAALTHRGGRGAALSGAEHRMVALVLAGPGGGAGGPRADLTAMRNAELEILANGSVVALIRGEGPTELAMEAARCALALRARLGSRPLAVVTGYDDASRAEPVGEVIDRAAGLMPGPSEIALDDVSAALLAERFVLVGPAGQRRLLGENDPQARATLSGAARFFGRDKEVATVHASLAQAFDGRESCAVVVTGAAGSGKSRLCREAVARARGRWPELRVWHAYGDPMHAGAPFAILAPLIRGAMGLRAGPEDASSRATARAELEARAPSRRVAEFLGEMIGCPFLADVSPALDAARADSALMADQLQRAWLEWVGAELNRGPVLWVLEDVHWGDTPSIRFVEAALRLFPEAPLAVVALARPEIHVRFPRLWADRGAHEVRLGPLSRRAAERLVVAIAGTVDEPRLAQILARAEGNAFFLEELALAAVDGRTTMPGSVLAMVHARLERLEPDVRRVLRAAAIAGETFWPGLVRVLTGLSAPSLDACLAGLVEKDLVVRSALARPGAPASQLAFRHGLLRDAAYAMLTDGDREVGHRLAAEWLEGANEVDASSIAEHFEKGKAPGQAVPHWISAAAQALSAHDLERVHAFVARGLACGATGEQAIALFVTQAEASFFAGNGRELARQCSDVLARARRGSTAWLRALGFAFLSRYFEVPLGDAVRGLAEDLESLTGEATDERLIAYGRVATGLVYNGDAARARAILELAERQAGERAIGSARVTAELCMARACFADVAGDLVGALPELAKALCAYEAAEHWPSVLIQRCNLGQCLALLGNYADALALLEPALAEGRRLTMTHLVHEAQYGLAVAQIGLGRVDEGLARLIELTTDLAPTDRMLGTVLVARGRAHLGRGEREHARADAEVAASLGGPSEAAARAVLAATHTSAAAALVDARRAFALLGGRVGAEHRFVRLAYAEALFANSCVDEARSVVADAVAAIRADAAGLESPSQRDAFLTLAENIRLLALAANA
jgi:tetratricopeptide (TPR) repeat protein